MIAYHIDRTNSLTPNSKLDYIGIPDNPNTHKLIELFDNKFTNHGNFYTADIDLRISPDLQFYNNSIIELTFELFRAAYFKNEPSRLSSVFFTDKDTLPYWLQRLPSDKPICILTADIPDSEPFDESFLKQAIGQEFINPGLLYDQAYKYWSHTKSDKPHFEYLVKPPVEFTGYYDL